MTISPTTETLENPEIDTLGVSVSDFVGKIISRYHDKPDSATGTLFQHFKNYGDTWTGKVVGDDSVVLGAYVEREVGRVKNVEIMYAEKYLNELFNDIYGKDGKGIPTYEDLSFIHNALDGLAESGIFDSKEKPQVGFANYAINRYVVAVRQYVLTDPSASDLLATASEDSRNAFRAYLAVESAVSGDFESAKSMLIDIDGEKSGRLETSLIARLEEAQKLGEQESLVSPEDSAENLRDSGLTPSPEAVASVEHSHPAVTIGTSIETLEDMLSPGGRYLTVSEFNLRSGAYATDSGTNLGKKDVDYNDQRWQIEKTIGYSDNPFTPRPIYGALTSDLQADRGSGYGRVILYPSPELVADSRTLFSAEDSLNAGTNNVRGSLLTYEDAISAYAGLIETKSDSMASDGSTYIEAQVPGIRIDQLSKIAITCDRKGEFASSAYKVVDSVIERGIPCDVQIDWTKWKLDEAIQIRIDDGMNKGEAYADMLKTLKSHSFQHSDSPLLHLVVYTTSEQQKAEGHLGQELNLDIALLEANGVTVVQPKFGELLSRSRR